jgi:4-amino-4-deoxy-L-arabinose transferase-like glycosyltransferase
MTLFATLALYALAKFATTHVPVWLYASGAAMGLTFLAKETGAVLLGAIYALLALSPALPVRIRDLAFSLGAFIAVIAAFPLALALAGAGSHSTAQQYLVWQLFRRPNHDAAFYLLSVPPAMGLLTLAVAGAGLWLTRREFDWRQRLLIAWIAVVVVFFQLWPVKGFQYLLPAAPAVAVLAALGVTRLARVPWRLRRRPGERGGEGALVSEAVGASAMALLIAGSLVLSSWAKVQPSSSPELLAGAGGVPGGRETGHWIRDNTPVGAQLMTIGPSMANIISFYGHRKAYGLSVSPNPLRRNPSYDPVNNPDLRIRSNELQYVVWDSYSAARSPFFAAKIFDYVDRYHGREVYTETVPGPDGSRVPVITVYEVRR